MFEEGIKMFTDIMQVALPIGIAFEIGNLVVGTFMRVAFGGKLWFSK